MNKLVLFLAWMIFISAFHFEAKAQKSKVVKWKDLEALMAEGGDSLTIINFWATWCKPCVKEIPHFEKLRKLFRDKPVRFRYISLDFKDQKSSKLDPFVLKNMKGARVWLLDETNYDTWISKVDPTWEGTIPVTLLVNNSKKIRKFVASELDEAQLHQIIQSFL